MDLLLTVGLPLSLAFIMFTLGLGLTFGDFVRVARAPRAFLIGAAAQLLLLPLVAYAILLPFDLDPALAFGMMILAFCPGGVTTNLLTKYARGDLALSISLTGIISLVSVLTLPVFVAVTARHFLGEEAAGIDVTALAGAMFLITAIPVILGMVLRTTAPNFTARVEPVASSAGTGLFVVIVVAALAANWQAFLDNIGTLGPILVALNLVLLAAGFALARLAGLEASQARAISIEAGVQNGTLGITVAGILSAGATLGPYAIPSAVYGITMYLVTLPIIFGLFRRISPR